MKRVATCNGPNCHAEIRWCRTQKGKKVPLDAEPTPDGDWMIEGDPDAPNPLALKLTAHTIYEGPRYEAHWGTCPDRDSFRRQKRGQP